MRHLAGRDDHHDQREDLAVAVAPHAREGDQREVRRVEHQLEAEQDHERVAAREHAGGADAEDQRRDDEVPADAHQPPSGPRAAAAAGARARAARARSPADRLGHRADAAAADVGDRDSSALVGAEAAAAAREHDRADGGDQQQQRGDLEREQELRQEQLADLARACRSRGHVRRAVGRRAPSGPSRASRSPARRTARARTAAPRTPQAAAAGGAQRLGPRRRRRRRRTRRAPSPRRRRRRPARRRRTRARSSRNSAASDDQVADQREHAVERVAQRHHADRAGRRRRSPR